MMGDYVVITDVAACTAPHVAKVRKVDRAKNLDANVSPLQLMRLKIENTCAITYTLRRQFMWTKHKFWLSDGEVGLHRSQRRS